MKMRKSHHGWRLVSLLSKKGRRTRFPVFMILPFVIGFFVIFILFTTLSDKSPTTITSLHTKFPLQHLHLPLLKVIKPSESFQSNFTLPKQNVHTTPIQPDWQIVAATSDKFYVYAAYYVETPSHAVRVIGAGKTKSRQRLQCRLYDRDGTHFNTSTATIRVIRENWNLKYSACFIICNLSPADDRPQYISVTSAASRYSISSNLLKVTYMKPKYSSEEDSDIIDFAACVKPIHFNYDNTLQFMEWMEFHKLMGVTHFTFYNHTIGHKVACLLRHTYTDMVTVLPWKLAMVSQKEIRTEGLFAALNDCIYRHRGKARNVVVVDLDELIVPNRAKDYYQLLLDVNTVTNKRNIGAYSFQNGFFYLQWPSDNSTVYNFTNNPLAETITKQLLTLRKLRRRSRLHPHKQRSKYICDPEKVVEAGNHFIWEMVTGHSTVLVPHHLAILHHYRLCEFGGNQCTKNPSLIDKSMVAFGKNIALNVAERVESAAETCSIEVWSS